MNIVKSIKCDMIVVMGDERGETRDRVQGVISLVVRGTLRQGLESRHTLIR